MDKVIENNQVKLSGVIDSQFEFDHEIFKEKFYRSYLGIQRLSGVEDLIPIVVSDRLIDATEDWTGRYVETDGQVRTYSKHDGEKNRLIIYFFAREINEVEGKTYDENSVLLDGYICKAPVYRKTPLGREITDVLLAVQRPYGKSDYIPVVFWGRNARYASKLKVGTHLHAKGRLQSRVYAKRLVDDTIERRTAYEVSVCFVEDANERDAESNGEEKEV